jgi:hypothetical protein
MEDNPVTGLVRALVIVFMAISMPEHMLDGDWFKFVTVNTICAILTLILIIQDEIYGS